MSRMMDKFDALLARWANSKMIGLLFLLALPFPVFFFRWRTSRLNALSGVTDPVLDARWYGYTPSTVDKLLSAYGQAGRRLYALSEVTLDLVFPILYTLLLSLLMTRIVSSAFPRRRVLQRLSFLPLLSLLSDYAENTSFVIRSLNYPNTLTPIAQLASVFTNVDLMGFIAAMMVRRTLACRS